MTDRIIPRVMYDKVDSRPSNVPTTTTFQEIVERRITRRQALKGFVAGAAGAVATTALGSGIFARVARAQESGASGLTFEPLPHVLDETHHVPPGYRADMLIRWGDPVLPGAPEFDPANQSAEAQDQQFGYNADFITYMPLPAGSDSSDHGILAVNHEYTIPHLMFPGYADSDAALAALTPEQGAIELAAHGMSFIEVRKENGNWTVVPDSQYARRITGRTPMRISGPAAGHDRMKTGSDPTGTEVLGTLNNCAGGWTPWGTVLTAEENFNGYFGGDVGNAPGAEIFRRYGISNRPWYVWHRFEDRFDAVREPNEANRFGWIVEIDPYDPHAMPVKRTALGRFKHEGATIALTPDGRVVAYSGDDERFEYIYRFVSTGRFNPDDRAANMDLLDEGTLSVARFDEDGTLAWLPLVHGEGPLTEENGFSSQADVVIEARRAADLLGATPMDRPEDIQPNPATGRVYAMLTNNTRREPEQVNAANTRPNNVWGQIVEMIPPGEDGNLDHAADTFRWDIFIQAGDPSDPEANAQYGGDLPEGGWFNNPDNVEFDPRGRIWIATDGFPDSGNWADGLWGAETTGSGRAVTKRFFASPIGAETCGPRFTPDGRTLFLAVQHPAETDGSTYENPSTRWPDFQDGMPPRPAVIVVTKEDGGEIGS